MANFVIIRKPPTIGSQGNATVASQRLPEEPGITEAQNTELGKTWVVMPLELV